MFSINIHKNTMTFLLMNSLQNLETIMWLNILTRRIGQSYILFMDIWPIIRLHFMFNFLQLTPFCRRGFSECWRPRDSIRYLDKYTGLQKSILTFTHFDSITSIHIWFTPKRILQFSHIYSFKSINIHILVYICIYICMFLVGITSTK